MRTETFDRQITEPPFNAVVGAVEVDDPWSPASGRPHRVTVTRSLRDDPLGRLHARRQIGEAEFRAGRAWQALYEAAEVGRVGAMDPSRVFVDGGRMAEPLNERQRRAARELARLDAVLGLEGRDLLRDVLGAGMTLAQASELRGGYSERYVAYLGHRVRECLATLAQHIRLAS